MGDTFKPIYTTIDLGETFRNERKALGKSQQWVADKCGLSRKTIVELEHGENVSVQTLLMACMVLGKRLMIVDKRPSIDEMRAFFGENDED